MYTYIRIKRNDHGSFSLSSPATTEPEEPPATADAPPARPSLPPRIPVARHKILPHPSRASFAIISGSF